MGTSDSSSFLDLLEKVRSWISWGTSDMSSSCLSTPQLGPKDVCAECDANSTNIFNGYRCRSCGRWLCVRCVRGYESCVAADESGHSVKFCKFCTPNRKNNQKVHPSDSPRESPEPPSPSFCGDLIHSDRLANYLESRDCGYSPHAESSRSVTSISAHPSPVSVRRYTSRSDEEEAEDSAKHFYSPSSEYFNDVSDIDSNSISARLDFYHYKSVGSSPLDSPSRSDSSYYRVSAQHEQEGSPLYQNGDCDQETGAILRRPAKETEDQENTDYYSDDTSTLGSQYEKPKKPLDFENNGRIWFPPLPEDENDDAESNFFSYDDDDDDIGESGVKFSSSSSLSSSFPSKEKPNEGNKEPIRVMVQGHFRALVAQLLQGEGIKVSKGDNEEDWVDIVTAIAWQAANFVKPDTSRGGSMDPVDYVKVKCVASGSPSDSTLVKGIVCTKNIKHKRMTTQYKNPRLLLLGGALDYQSVVNQLASFNTLVKQENDHLKTIVSKIEALRPNVLLVEKSVSSYAQEYLLAKDISLVLNVKKPLLERIGRCTGAFISPSIGSISSTRLGHCELFRVERVSEEHENVNQFNRKPSKTLMFFEGCPRRLGCTVLLRGTRREELKKIKHVVQYAIFAAHHLSLETSFLADEGASLPMSDVRHSIAMPERAGADSAISVIPPTNTMAADASTPESGFIDLSLTGSESLSGLIETSGISPVSPAYVDCKFGDAPSGLCHDDLASKLGLKSFALEEHPGMSTITSPGIENVAPHEFHDMSMMASEERKFMETHKKSDKIVEDEVSSEYFPATDTHQSILVSFSSRCVLKGTVCERSRLLRIKFYGSFDKPLGRYLRDDLFDQTSYCRSCKEPAEAHVLCYTHQQGNLTISVRSLSSVKLPGEQDGKIWMWHRCLRCAHIDGVPPATHRVIMSDAAWGLSFGKFLELSFTNHTTANRVAPCGHSLQRDCLRFYGFGSMVVFFRYSPIDILNVHLPPSVLEFNGHAMQGFIRKEAEELLGKMETTYTEILDALERLGQKSISIGSEFSDINDLQRNILELKDQLRMERNDYSVTLQLAVTGSSVDILELNHLRRALLIGSHAWGRKLYSLDTLLKKNSAVKAKQGDAIYSDLKGPRCNSFQGSKLGHGREENISGPLKPQESVHTDPHLEQNEVGLPCKSLSYEHLTSFPFLHDRMEIHSDADISARNTFSDKITSQTPDLSDRIDSAWTGKEHLPVEFQPLHLSQVEGFNAGSMRQLSLSDNPSLKRAMAPVRVQSFDSALRIQDRIQKGLPPSSLYLSTLKSFHASGDYRGMVRDPVSNVTRTYSQILPLEAQKMNLILTSTPSFVSSAFDMAGGARLLLSQRGKDDVVVGVYDNDPASIISYALSSKEYEDWVAGNSNEKECVASTFSTRQSFGSPDLDFVRHGSYGSEDTSSSIGTLFTESKKSPHLTVSYGDESSIAVGGGKVKFSVTCYFARQFVSLRKKCCPSEVDFIRSLSRCRRWNAQGGKSNVYFAKSLDERFIIKQVIKTELDSFEEFASEYFNYLTDSLSSGSPTCLAKILGIYQVTEKHLKGGKETKRDLVVMENLFFNRNISKVYDLKGSVRSRYNTDTTGTDKVLLDMNLVETLRTEPIFLGSKAKRILERAIWNDTVFLASVDVMDYSLLVGVDEERKELVLGIIDFMRQYTWDKHLETWVKASGILGGPKNAPPTIVSPQQYKKRFRKAMTSYFLTVPDQWSS